MVLGHFESSNPSPSPASEPAWEGPRGTFYRRLFRLLAEHDFDTQVERLCEPYYARGRGRKSLPPGIYFRMMVVGFFERYPSQRWLAKQVAQQQALRSFIGFGCRGLTPNHSTLTVIRHRLPAAVHRRVFGWVAGWAAGAGLLEGAAQREQLAAYWAPGSVTPPAPEAAAAETRQGRLGAFLTTCYSA